MRPLQKQIIDELKVLPEIDPEKEIRRSVDFIKAYLLKYPFFKSIVLGISGGQDSTLCGTLCQKQSASFVKKRETLITSLLPFACRMAIKPMNRMQWTQSSS